LQVKVLLGVISYVGYNNSNGNPPFIFQLAPVDL